MIEIKESHADILQVRYADFFDGTMTPYDTAFGHWWLSKFCRSEAHQITWKNSLFGGLESHDERHGSMSLDVFSGAFMCWDKKMSRAIDEIYTHEFSDVLNSLEYEKDDEWVSRVPLDPLPFNLQQVDENHPADLQ